MILLGLLGIVGFWLIVSSKGRIFKIMSNQKKYRVREDEDSAYCGYPWVVEYLMFLGGWNSCQKWAPDWVLGMGPIDWKPASFKTEGEAIIFAEKLKSLNKTWEPPPKDTGKIIAI